MNDFRSPENILSGILESSGKWFGAKDIKDAWQEFKTRAKEKTAGIAIPTSADKAIIWNLFYDLMLGKIEPINREMVLPEDKKLCAVVEGKKQWLNNIREKLYAFKEDVINYIYPPFMESVEYGSDLDLSSYSKALAGSYGEANYDFQIGSGDDIQIITVNLIKNYGALKILCPGFETKPIDSIDSILKEIVSADVKIFNSVDSLISELENNLTIKRIGWKFEDRNGLKRAIISLDGSAPRIFRKQFTDLIGRLPYFGSSTEESERIYDLLVYGTSKNEADLSVEASISKPKEPEEDPTLYPSVKKEPKPVSPTKLTVNLPAHGEAERIDRENIRSILSTINKIVNSYQENYFLSYEGTNKLVAGDLLGKDPSRNRPGLGSRSGINDQLKKISLNLGIPNTTIGEIKAALIQDSNNLIPNMIVSFKKFMDKTKTELIDPWVESNFNLAPAEGESQSDADFMRSASMPEFYSRYAQVDRDPIVVAYKKLIQENEEEQEEAQFESEEEIMSAPGLTTSERQKELRKLSSRTKEKEAELNIEKRVDSLSNTFLEIIKNSDKTTIIDQLKNVFVNEMTKLSSGADKPIFSRMVRKLFSGDLDVATRKSLPHQISDLIAEINTDIDPKLAQKLIFAAIANNDFEVLDLLIGIKEIKQSRKSADGLIRAAALVGDADTMAWVINYISNLPNPPMVSLKDISFERLNETGTNYRAMKRLGLSNKSAIVSALPQPSSLAQARELYKDKLYDIIESYGRDAINSAREGVKNPTPEFIAERAIKKSAIKFAGSDELLFILNPMNWAKDSAQYSAIVKELLSMSQPKSLTAHDHLQKFDEFKDIPQTWKPDATLGASTMVNKLQQELSALIRELSGNLLIAMKKARGKDDSADDLIYRLPTQVKMYLRKYIDDDELDEIITHNTVVPANQHPRDDADKIGRDLVNTHKRLKKWLDEYHQNGQKLSPIEAPDEQEDLAPESHKLIDMLPSKPGVSSEIDEKTSRKQEKQLKTEIENLELELKTSNLSIRQKQKELEKLSEKRDELRKIQSEVNQKTVDKAKQKAAYSTEIERLIEAKPEEEQKIKKLVNAGKSFADIVDLISL